MPRFRDAKARLAAVCLLPDWKTRLEQELQEEKDPKSVLSPLLALLPRPELRYQAAYGIGIAVSALADADKEAARVFLRRLMWSLNEESGNLGWGVPEAMGCILARHEGLAREYARIFLSYGYQTGKDDNFLDHAPLRQGVYWGVGILAQSNPREALPALPHLCAALADPSPGVRLMAAWAIRQLALHAQAPCASGAWETIPAVLGKAAGQEADHRERFFDGAAMADADLASVAAKARDAVSRMFA